MPQDTGHLGVIHRNNVNLPFTPKKRSLTFPAKKLTDCGIGLLLNRTMPQPPLISLARMQQAKHKLARDNKSITKHPATIKL